jgi:hypothetical protein
MAQPEGRSLNAERRLGGQDLTPVRRDPLARKTQGSEAKSRNAMRATMTDAPYLATENASNTFPGVCPAKM